MAELLDQSRQLAEEGTQRRIACSRRDRVRRCAAADGAGWELVLVLNQRMRRK